MEKDSLLLIVVVFVLIFIFLEDDRKVEKPTAITPSYGTYLPPLEQMEEMEEFKPQEEVKIEAPDYMTLMKNTLISEKEHENQKLYADKRFAAGDFTRQIHGVRDGLYGRDSNFIGINRKPKYVYDPTSPFSYSDTTQSGLVDTQNDIRRKNV